jgi:hypothetical protein
MQTTGLTNIATPPSVVDSGDGYDDEQRKTTTAEAAAVSRQTDEVHRRQRQKQQQQPRVSEVLSTNCSTNTRLFEARPSSY